MKDDYECAFVEGGIRTAVKLWCTDRAAAKKKYGHIASWDTSDIVSMENLFFGQHDFNDDISRWDVSSVRYMDGIFHNVTRRQEFRNLSSKRKMQGRA
mmetsp:Transcript_13323/g.23343  ORF Transcript_13323/g.23343 Transcript_13323/m.23343 type:complete len:98 (-) Transcript_13323:137-430(-)